MSSSNGCFLASIQFYQEAGKVVWYSHLLKNFYRLLCIEGFSVVSEAEVDVFLEFSSFFYDPTDVGNLISGSSAFSKSSLNIWKFSVHVMLKHRFENFEHYFVRVWASLVPQMVKHLPAKGKTWVQSLGREDPLEKEMATHSSTLAWKIPWTEEPGKLQSMGSQRVGHDWVTSLHFHFVSMCCCCWC